MREFERDDLGLRNDDWRWIAWEQEREMLRLRWRALRALWCAPVVDRVRRDGVVCHRDGRGEDWTPLRAARATIGVILGLWDRSASWTRFDMAFWDSHSTYGGWTVDCLGLGAWCRVEIYDDGDTSL